MYEHLCKRVDSVVNLANKIAREYEQEYVGTEHILLAIVQEGTGVGARILLDRGATEERIRAEVDKLIKASLEDTWVFGRLPGTPHFRNVIAQAIEEARKLNNKQVCTEHLLLGLLKERGCVAQEALRRLGFSTRSVREAVRRISAAKTAGTGGN